MPNFNNPPTASTATLTGRIDILPRLTPADLDALPAAVCVKVVTEFGNAVEGFGAVITPSGRPPLSTQEVAREIQALIDALPGHEFEGVMSRQAGARFGGAFSTIGALGRTVKF